MIFAQMNRAIAIAFVALALLACATADEATPIEVQDEVALFEEALATDAMPLMHRKLLDDDDDEDDDDDKDNCARWTWTTSSGRR